METGLSIEALVFFGMGGSDKDAIRDIYSEFSIRAVKTRRGYEVYSSAISV